MSAQMLYISQFILNAFLHIWPYLLVTIPLAVAVRMSGAARYIDKALRARPFTAILLAGVVGAFSPFCSCGVIPVVAALLIGGVPLAPVMTFWIASPSMDPEIFFLSVATIGWELAVWRLAATLALSLSAGFITHLILQRGWLGQRILLNQDASRDNKWTARIRSIRERLLASLTRTAAYVTPAPAAPVACCAGEAAAGDFPMASTPPATGKCASNCDAEAKPAETCGDDCGQPPRPLGARLFRETMDATVMVVKFMALAFFLEALIKLYVPSEWIAGLLGRENAYAIPTAALLGVPVYTSNLTALPMIGGLLDQGMNPAAALAFLIAGPTTTLPAMAAVWGLVTRRVFALYVSFSLIGALVLGYAYALVSRL